MAQEALHEANKRLDALVSELSALQDDDPSRAGIVTDYVLVYAAQRFEADGTQTTAVGWVYPGDGQPHYRTLGLVDQFSLELRDRLRRELADDDDA